jgi:hypothetical protein
MVKTLDCRFSCKTLGQDGERRGEFTGLASVFNVVDLDGDIVLPGAFARSIQRSGGRVKLLYQHDTKRPIGIGEVSENEIGLVLKGRLSLGVRDGQEAYQLMLDRVLDSMSIGYEVVRSRPARAAGAKRELVELNLFEVSPVTFAANVLATINDVKGAGDGLTHFRRLMGDVLALTRKLEDEQRDRVDVATLLADRLLLAKARRVMARLGEVTR